MAPPRGTQPGTSSTWAATGRLWGPLCEDFGVEGHGKGVQSISLPPLRAWTGPDLPPQRAKKAACRFWGQQDKALIFTIQTEALIPLKKASVPDLVAGFVARFGVACQEVQAGMCAAMLPAASPCSRGRRQVGGLCARCWESLGDCEAPHNPFQKRGSSSKPGEGEEEKRGASRGPGPAPAPSPGSRSLR